MKLKPKFLALSALSALFIVLSPVQAQNSEPSEPGQKGPRAAIQKEEHRTRQGEGRMGHNRGHDRALQALTRSLELNDGQVESFRQLMEAQREAMRPLRESLIEENRRLRELLDQDNPDPTAIGNSALAAREHRLRIQAVREQSREAFRNLLTPSQEQELDEMLQSPRARRMFGALGGFAEAERERQRARRFGSPPMQ